jgi:hypothetical protein
MLTIPIDSKNQVYAKFIREIKLDEFLYGEVIYEGLGAIDKNYRKSGLVRRFYHFKDQLLK